MKEVKVYKNMKKLAFSHRKYSMFLAVISLLLISVKASPYQAPNNEGVQVTLINMLWLKIKKNLNNNDQNNDNNELKINTIKNQLTKDMVVDTYKNKKKQYNLVHYATETNDEPLLTKLLSLDLPTEFFIQKDNQGWTPLHYANLFIIFLVLSKNFSIYLV